MDGQRQWQPIYFAVILGFLIFPLKSFSFDTEQFTLPPRPLQDLGEKLDTHLREIIQKACADTNGKIEYLIEQAHKRPSLSSYAQQAAEALQRPAFISALVFFRTGMGIPESTVEKWLGTYDFGMPDVRFKPSWSESIFKYRPLYYQFTSQTVNVFGVHLGTDKMGHFFQQGYTYYLRFEGQRQLGLDDKSALENLLMSGVFSEYTYFGKGVTGGMSRADLATNYAGMKFYMNLTEKLDIPGAGDPILDQQKQTRHDMAFKTWRLNPDRKEIMRPFISDHMNEALNPSSYGYVNYKLFFGQVQTRCPSWFQKYPKLSRQDVEHQLKELSTWHGENYGHPGHYDGVISLANACF